MGPIFSHCEYEEHGSAEMGISPFKREKGQKGRGRRDGNVLGREKRGFQDGSTNLSKTTNGFCWLRAFVRRCHRLR